MNFLPLPLGEGRGEGVAEDEIRERLSFLFSIRTPEGGNEKGLKCCR